MSNDIEQEYFSDGITEEIINVFAQIPSLKVAGRTSSFSFKNNTILNLENCSFVKPSSFSSSLPARWVNMVCTLNEEEPAR